MSLVDDVQQYLASAGVVDGSTDWLSSRRNKHDAQDQLVVITEDGGPEPEVWSAEGVGDSALMEPAVQVLVRAAEWDGDAAYDKAAEIFGVLHSLQRQTVGETWYMQIKAQTPSPLFIGYDEKRRPEFTTSFRALRAVMATS